MVEIGKSGGTYLHFALQKGSSLKTIQDILKSSVNVNSINHNYDTPIFVALYTHFNNEDIIKELLRHGASVRVFNKRGETPLHVALMKEKKLEIIQDILKYGADVNVADADGNTAIFKVLYHKHDNLEVIKELLRHGACVKVTNKFGQTPLYVALHQRKNIQIIQELLNYGSDVNTKSKNGFTPIFESLYSFKIFKELLKKGASVLEKSESGYTLLHLAVQSDNPKIVEEILNYGADANAKTHGGITPLYTVLLSFPPNFQVVKDLLKYGASIHECFDLEFFYKVIEGSEIALEVLKYSVLEHPNAITCNVCEEWGERSKANIMDCKYEIDTMKSEYISNKLTLLNFVSQEYDYGKLVSTGNDVLYENTFLEQLHSRYPIYHEIILNRLETRTYLLRKLCDFSFCIKPTDTFIFLNSLCLREIGKCLTNRELKNFIKALSTE